VALAACVLALGLTRLRLKPLALLAAPDQAAQHGEALGFAQLLGVTQGTVSKAEGNPRAVLGPALRLAMWTRQRTFQLFQVHNGSMAGDRAAPTEGGGRVASRGSSARFWCDLRESTLGCRRP
jgi:hypothetical protein